MYGVISVSLPQSKLAEGSEYFSRFQTEELRFQVVLMLAVLSCTSYVKDMMCVYTSAESN